jgi:signal transduction histidine kinase
MLASDDAGYTIDYTDSVTGLDPALVAQVGFARFTTKPNGTGLGVWLVGRVAALHGGRLDTSLTAAGGLRFTMTFPAGGLV